MPHAPVLRVGLLNDPNDSKFPLDSNIASKVYSIEAMTNAKPKKFQTLVNKMSRASRARIKAKTRRLIADMGLAELREARRLTQQQLAQLLSVKQPSIAKIERRADMYVSTLRGIIKAMGGEMEILAVFPDGKVRISSFRNLSRKRP